MSNEYLLHAESRSDTGKGASRRLRREQHRVPAIIYGGDNEPEMVTLELRELARALENEAFFSHILTIKHGDREEKAVLRDLQRHPAKGTPMHADLMRVDARHKITMTVPLHFENEDNCVGVKEQKGQVTHYAADVEVSCLPQNLPEYIEVDVKALRLGEMLHLSDIKVPAGVELVALALGEDHDHPVVAVQEVKAAPTEEEEEAAAAEEEAASGEGEQDQGEEEEQD